MKLPQIIKSQSSILLSNCLINILMQLSSNNSCIFVVDFKSKLQLPIVIYDSDIEPIQYHNPKVDIYVLDTRLKGLNWTIQFLEKRTFFNPRAVFVIITQKFVDDFYELLKGYYIETTIILEYGSDSQLKLFEEENNRISLSQTVCKGERLKLHRLSHHFQKEKSPVIHVGAGPNVPSVILSDEVPTSGVHMDILKIISEKLRFETEISVVDVFAGKKNTKDFSFNGSLGFLERGEVELVIGGVLPTSEGCLSFDFTRTTSSNRYAVIVPAAKVRPFWKRPLLTFSPTVWIIFAVTFIINLVISSLVNKLVMKGFFNWDKELLKLYSMCFTSVSVKNSEMRSKKILYTSWYLFLLIFIDHFTAKLLSNLVVKKFEYQIHKLQELKELDWKICIFSDLREDLGYFEEDEILSCTDCATCTNKTAYDGNVVSIRSEKLTLYEMNSFYINEDREPLVFILQQSYLSTYDVVVFRKNHPLFRTFDKVLGHLIESGVYDRIERKYSSAVIDRNPKKSWMRLNLNQLDFIFKFLFDGLTVSFLIFVIEIFTKNMNWSNYEKQVEKRRKTKI